MTNYFTLSENKKIKLISRTGNNYFYLDAYYMGEILIFIFDNMQEMQKEIAGIAKFEILDVILTDDIWQISSSDTNKTTTNKDFIFDSDLVKIAKLEIDFGIDTEICYGFILNK